MKIKIYGADWCSDCLVLKKILDEKEIEYEYIVCTDNQEVIDFIKKNNNGKRIIPTLDIDGKIYSNPGVSELLKIIEQ